MIRFKAEVRIGDFTDPLIVMLRVAAQWSLARAIDIEINSIDDGVGVHMPTTLHGWSLAVDFDTVGDKEADTRALGEFFRRRLPTGFDIVLEGDHVHVEYDTHRAPLPAVTREMPATARPAPRRRGQR